MVQHSHSDWGHPGCMLRILADWKLYIGPDVGRTHITGILLIDVKMVTGMRRIFASVKTMRSPVSPEKYPS